MQKRINKPPWLKKKLPLGGGVKKVEDLIADQDLNTVCHNAKCPNQNECFHEGSATFLILGSVCTRSCSFCSIKKRSPQPLDPMEPEKLAKTIQAMKLSYAVITSVTRDDLPDGGASHFAAVIRALKNRSPDIKVEILIPDFQGDGESLNTVMAARPAVLNHNIETVPSLYEQVRPGADYQRSLDLLRAAASFDPAIPAKSGLMLGLGEKEDEVKSLMNDLRENGVELMTIGQYLQPIPECLEVREYIHPDKFDAYAAYGEKLGFAGISSGPFVRSSHRAKELYAAYLEKRMTHE